MKEDSTTTQMIKRMDERLEQRLPAAVGSTPWRRWLMAALIPALVSLGTCISMSDINVNTPSGNLHWQGAETEE